MAKLDKRFEIKKQRYIDKYSSTNDVKDLNDKGMKKFDKEELEVNYELYKITSNRVC